MKNMKFSIQTVIITFVLAISLLVAVSACSSPTTTAPTTSSAPATTAKPPATSPAVTASSSPSPLASPTPTASPIVTPSNTPSTSPPPVSPSVSPAAFTINVSSKTGIGNYLVDAKGMALYYWANDVYGKSNATSAVLQAWPVFYASNVNIPSSLVAGDFTVINRTDGSSQTAYKGWPLYYFANDKAQGDTLGDGIGGVWFLVKIPFYTVMLQNRTDFGKYLVDPKGMTLYYYNKDSAGTSNVSGATLSVWPIFNAATFVVPSGLNAADFGSITRTDGQKQATYKGFPLYYYANDKISGDALGNGVGGVWFVISPASFPPTPKPTTQSGGQSSGY